MGKFKGHDLSFDLPKVGDTLKRAGTTFEVVELSDKLEVADEHGIPAPEGAIGLVVLDGVDGAHAGYRYVGFIFSDQISNLKRVAELEEENGDEEEETEDEPEDESEEEAEEEEDPVTPEDDGGDKEE